MSRSFSTVAAVFVAFSSLAACGDDGPSGPAGTLANLANDLAGIVEDQVVEDETQNSIKELAEALSQSLTTSTPAPQIRDGGVMGVAQGLRNNGEAWGIPEAGSAPFSKEPRVPLDGITCVWDTGQDFWVRDAADPFGPVAQGSVRFALYDALNGEPLLPLNQIPDAFTDIAPVQQAPANNGNFQVDLYAEEGSGPRIDGTLSGTFVNGLINATFGGLIGADLNGIGFSALISESGETSSLTISTILAANRAILIDLTFDPDGSGTVIVLGLRGDPTNPDAEGNFLVQFEVPFSASFLPTGGEVLVNNEVVGTVTGGTIGVPTFTVDPEGTLGTSSEADLDSIYATAWTLYAHFVELLNLGLCVGTEDTSICNLLFTS